MNAGTEGNWGRSECKGAETLVCLACLVFAGAGVLGSGGSAPVVRHVLYGATDMLTGEQTVKQLAELGRLSSLGPGGIDIAGPAGPAAANGSK